MTRLIQLIFIFTISLIFQSCSYIDAMKRAEQNKEIKGTKAYYDNKCLIADECARVSARLLLAEESSIESMIIAIVVDDGNESRVIDLQTVSFTKDQGEKVTYFFFDLPVGSYHAYALKIPENIDDYSDLQVLGQLSGKITANNLKAYQNAIILDDITIDKETSSKKFAYSLQHMQKKLMMPHNKPQGYFDDNVTLDAPVFSHETALQGLYYPKAFAKKTQGLYRLAPKHKAGSIPLILVHGMAGTPRDWKYMLAHLDLTHFTPYVVYYPSGEDFTKLSAQFNAWILSDKIFDKGPGVIIAHSFGGIIVRDASNLQQNSSRHSSGLFISIATPYGGDETASEGVKNAPYVIPAWRSIASDSIFIKNLYRESLSKNVDFELIFAYDNNEEGLSGDGRVPLKMQLRSEAQAEATHMHGFNEDHISILRSKETTDYINTLLQQFVKEHIDQK